MKSPSASHILILCSELYAPSGGNRVIVNLANLFVEQGYAVTLGLLDETKNSFYPVHQDVQVVQEPLLFGMTESGNPLTRKLSLLGDIKRLKKRIRALQPHIIIATEYHLAITAVLAGVQSPSRIISWEHAHFYALEKSLFWRTLFRLVYPRLDAVVCLNEDEKKLFETVNHRVRTIPNFILPPDAPVHQTPRQTLILTVGHLIPIKGTDLLLQAAKTTLQRHPSWKWKIIGEGAMKAQVEDFIKAEHLQDRLLLEQPASHDLSMDYQNASLLVLPSRRESFGMVLLEAMSYSLPCISFDCETGPRHIINHHETGLLVEKENPMALADALTSLIMNEEKRKEMGQKALVHIQRFSPEHVLKLWEQLFSELRMPR